MKWIIQTRYDSRRPLDRDVVELLNEQHSDRVTPPVREAVAGDAYTAGMPVGIHLWVDLGRRQGPASW